MRLGHLKTTAAFLLFFLICLGRTGFSLGVEENGLSSPKENDKTKTVRYSPMEMDRHPLAVLNLESPRETARAFWNNMDRAFAAARQ